MHTNLNRIFEKLLKILVSFSYKTDFVLMYFWYGLELSLDIKRVYKLTVF